MDSSICPFCSIINKHDKDSIIFEDNYTLAFLDNRPLFVGHTLLIPKAHFGTLTDLPEDLIYQFFLNVKIIDLAIQKAIPADGSLIAINNKISQSIPHLHVHIVPRKRKDGLRGFFWPRINYESETAKRDIIQKIKNEISIHFEQNKPLL